jgi:hypothetical protein
MKYKIGQLFFWYSKEGLFGKAIDYYNRREFGDSKSTHIGIISKVEGKKVFIHEATNKGFIKNEYDADWLDGRIDAGIVHIGESKVDLINIEETCNKYNGIRYGWLDILGIGLSALLGWKVLGITGKNAIICSEAVARILYDCSDGKLVLGYSDKSDYDKAEYKIKFDAVSPMHIFLSKQIRIL